MVGVLGRDGCYEGHYLRGGVVDFEEGGAPDLAKGKGRRLLGHKGAKLLVPLVD